MPWPRPLLCHGNAPYCHGDAPCSPCPGIREISGDGVQSRPQENTVLKTDVQEEPTHARQPSPLPFPTPSHLHDAEGLGWGWQGLHTQWLQRVLCGGWGSGWGRVGRQKIKEILEEYLLSTLPPCSVPCRATVSGLRIDCLSDMMDSDWGGNHSFIPDKTMSQHR